MFLLNNRLLYVPSFLLLKGFYLCQDQIPPFPTYVAIKSIESELGLPISAIFADISPKPIAAASLGQVYKG